MAGDIRIAGHFTKSSVHAVQQDFKRLDKAAERAAMWSVREVGRVFKRTAMRGAPVYSGKPRMVRVDGQLVPLIPRELKKSIHSSKRLKKRGPGDFSLVTGPRGAHVRLYAARQEARKPFIKPAYDEALSQARSIHERALAKALRKGR